MNRRAHGKLRAKTENQKNEKKTKITLRTKIYLTIVALLALTAGVFYASNPTPFSGGVPFPNGVAASPDFLLVTSYCDENIYSIDCNGTATVVATLPGFGSCREKYMTIVPTQAAARGFTPRDVFVTEGPQVFRIDTSTNTVTLFADISTVGGCSSDHNAVTFDHFGSFNFDMIVTCKDGQVYRIDNLPGGPHITQVGNFFPACGATAGEAEGAAVVPLTFGPQGGQIWVADEQNNFVHAMKNDGTITCNIVPHVSAERVMVVPSPMCTYCNDPALAMFQAEQQLNQFVWRYPLSDFTLFSGNAVMVTSEQGASGADTSMIQFNGTNYVQTSFAPRIPGLDEGGSFVDCDVPTATPTPTPSATFTPTATATATATATPTPTPTPTVTPTTCGTAFVIGDLDAVVGNTVTFWGAQWWKKNHLSGGTAPASFKGFANCTTPNPPTCGGGWISDPGNSSHPPATVPADITVIVSSLITKSGS